MFNYNYNFVEIFSQICLCYLYIIIQQDFFLVIMFKLFVYDNFKGFYIEMFNLFEGYNFVGF